MIKYCNKRVTRTNKNDPIGTVKDIAYSNAHFSPWGTVLYAYDYYQAYESGGAYGVAHQYGGQLGQASQIAIGAGVSKAICRYGTNVAKPSVQQNPGVPFRGQGQCQIGVDPNTLTLSQNFTPNPAKYASALARIKSSGMYGTIEVMKNGLVLNGQHRVLIGRLLNIAVDIEIK